MTNITGLDASLEQRLLLMELDHIRADWPMDARTMDAILGFEAGARTEGADRALPAYAEAQLRRFLEVATIANAILGRDGAREWFATPEAALGYSTPLGAMQRPGGLSYVRDLLRDAWEDEAPMARMRNGRS